MKKDYMNAKMPPNRPRHIDKYEMLTVDRKKSRDNFMMDFENACLEYNWINHADWPKGQKRHENPEWQKMIQTQVYPNHSDIDWQEYVDWVENGGGDEWVENEK